MQETPSSDNMSTSLLRLAALSRQHPQRCFTNLNQYLTKDLLRAAFHQTRKDGAAGVDGQTAVDYAQDLEGNLDSLLNRAKSGCYHAPSVRRCYIPKGNGQRPIGIPTFEDKVLQRAVVQILEKLYEPIFHPHSFGYRPSRGAHHALELLRRRLMRSGGGMIIEMDIEGFFDNLDKQHLGEFLRQRMGDGVLQRLINKWLKAGVMEAGTLHYPEKGSPQGGVISPLLANVYLHYVLDTWFEGQVKPRLLGSGCMIRFADDAVLLTQNDRDAQRVMEVLPKRFDRYGLSLHPEKTCVTVLKPQEKSSVDFLGFTHFWGKSRYGQWTLKRKTMKARFARGIKLIQKWCRENRHQPLRQQYAVLCRKIHGHNAYYGLSGNLMALKRYRYCVERVWVKWLKRRSQKHILNKQRVAAFLKRYALPAATIKPRGTRYA